MLLLLPLGLTSSSRSGWILVCSLFIVYPNGLVDICIRLRVENIWPFCSSNKYALDSSKGIAAVKRGRVAAIKK